MSFACGARKQFETILRDLGWEEDDLNEKAENLNKEEKKEQFSFYSKEHHPNIVEIKLDNPSTTDRLTQYKQVVDIGILERLDRDIKPLKPSPFEEFTKEDHAKSNTENKKMKFLSIQNDYKRRRQKYRGSKVKQTPKQVKKNFCVCFWKIFM